MDNIPFKAWFKVLQQIDTELMVLPTQVTHVWKVLEEMRLTNEPTESECFSTALQMRKGHIAAGRILVI